MTRRLCKLNRHEIAANLGQIHAMVSSPKYLCRSCSRASQDKAQLCKPAAIPPQACLDNPRQPQCGLVLESLAKPVPSPSGGEVVALALSEVASDQREKDKKALKQLKKINKKLAKALKKQQKLFKKARKAEKRYQKLARSAELIQAAEKAPRALH